MTIDNLKQMLEHEMDKHGLIDDGWTYVINNARRKYGYCVYEKKLIGISYRLAQINSTEQTLNTILHEIAHALTPFQHHNAKWRAKCVELGIKPERTGGYVTPPKKYIAKCPKCLRIHTKNRRRNVACLKCCNKFNKGQYSPEFKIVYEPNPYFTG